MDGTGWISKTLALKLSAKHEDASALKTHAFRKFSCSVSSFDLVAADVQVDETLLHECEEPTSWQRFTPGCLAVGQLHPRYTDTAIGEERRLLSAVSLWLVLLAAGAMLAHIMVSERTITTITEYLVADHARLHSLLARAMAAPQLDLEAFAEFRGGLLRHIAIEEKVLLPAVREARGASLDRAHELRIDHAALSSLLVPTPDPSLCREILLLLSAHDEKEEGPSGVYQECQRWLSDDELVLLAQRAAAFPEIRVARHFDGPNVYRTAKSALASAQRIRAPSKDKDE